MGILSKILSRNPSTRGRAKGHGVETGSEKENKRRGKVSEPKNVRRPSHAAPVSKNPGIAEDLQKDSATGRARAVLLGAAKLVLIVGVLCGTIWGGYKLYGHATTSAYFAVTNIDLEGQRRLVLEDVTNACGPLIGANIFSVDAGRLAAQLREEPWIADARVARVLPRTVKIEIVERTPEAVIIFDVPYLVDDGGVIFKRWTPGDPTDGPVFTGLTREDLSMDEEGVVDRIRDGIALARRYKAAGLEASTPLAEIFFEPDGGLSMTVGNDPFYLKFGAGPYREKLVKLAALLRRMKQDGDVPQIIFFDNKVRPDRVTVRLKGDAHKPKNQGVEVSLAD